MPHLSEFRLIESKGVPFLVHRDGTIRSADRETPYVREGRPHIVLMMKFKGRVLRPCKNNMGYLEVSTKYKSRKATKELVHRLVAKAYVHGYEEGLTVNHKNGDKLDNRPENLEWVSKGANTIHAWENGLVPLVGERNPGAKLSETQVVAIKALRNSGARAEDLATAVGVSISTIYKACAGSRWAHVTRHHPAPDREAAAPRR